MGNKGRGTRDNMRETVRRKDGKEREAEKIDQPGRLQDDEQVLQLKDSLTE